LDDVEYSQKETEKASSPYTEYSDVNDRKSSPSPDPKSRNRKSGTLRKGNSTANLRPPPEQMNRVSAVSGLKKQRRSMANLKAALDKVIEPELEISKVNINTKSHRANAVPLDDVDSEDEFRPHP